MIRTRDFVLFAVAVVFLLIAIVSTAGTKSEVKNWWSELSFSEKEVVYTAEILESGDSGVREQRMKEMRDKIAKSDVVINNPIVEEVVVEDEKDDGETEVVLLGDIDNCPNQISVGAYWSPSGLRFEVVEGVRLVLRGRGEISLDDELPETVLQLPLRSTPSVGKYCLPYNVIGVATDGSLIKNNEHTVYSIFGPETLIGYALDGFPIYGKNSIAKTDVCGGVIESGQYRYYISPDREGVIGCFSGEPVSAF